MTNSNLLQIDTSVRHRLKPPLSLILVGILTACSDAGIDEMGPQEATSAAVPIAVSPSLSASELTHDGTVTVQEALAIEAQINSPFQIAVESPAAANPAVVAPQPIISVEETNTDETLDVITSTENPLDSSEQIEPEIEPEIEAAIETGTGTGTGTGTEQATDTMDVTPVPDTQVLATTDSDDLIATSEPPASTENATDSESAPVDNGLSSNTADTPVTDIKTQFASKTTPGFEGEVLEDSIRITWPETPTARGYNVYKQADFYKTVFDTELIDTEVFDDDYYYEIQAFDNDDYLWYVATGLTVSARTIGKTDPDAPKPKEDLLDDYELVFSDEFNNTELDKSKWNTSFLWGTDLFINNEEQYYVDIVNDPDFGFNPFTFDGENLTISTIETPTELSEKAKDQPYLSGIITSYDAFKFTYGYAETRAKFTHGRGYWPAFWLLNAYYVDAKPEIDIMEFIGHNQDVVYHTYHYFDSEGKLRSTQSYPIPGIDFTSEFHTFGVEWMPGTLIFYVDGIETYKIVDINVSQQEMYVIANQAVGGWWAGSPDETTPLPGEYVLDYIRIYQRTTPYEIIEFDQPNDLIPLFSDNPGKVLPNKRPSIQVWPEGYPDGQ